MNASCILLLAVTAGLSGCAIDRVSYPVRHETRTIERDTSETARVNLEMGAGDLHVAGGAQDLVQADFNYNVPSLRPELHYHTFAGRAEVTIRQRATGDFHRFASTTKYGWDLRLNNEIPMDFKLHFGAGEAHLNLASLNLRGVEVEMGVGKIQVDLRGTPKRDYEVRIRGGIGEATLYLPQDAGISAKAQGGLGQVEVVGLRKDNGHWVNALWDS